MKRTILVSSLCLVFAGAGGYSVHHALASADRPSTIPRDLVSYRDVVKRVLPAVVSIEAKSKVHMMGMGAPAKSQSALGSGFVVDPSGIILTNDHVVHNATDVQVQFQDGRRFAARKITEDPKSDLAVVRVDTKEKLPYLKLGDSDAMEVGDRVLAIGAPLGLTGTVTSGTCS
jgi:serine protease Do